MTKSSEKILNTNAVYSSTSTSNHNLSASTSNGFQLVKAQNGTASMDGQINHGFSSEWNDNWGNDSGNGAAASGHTSTAMDQQPMIQSVEKSISNKSHNDGATALNVNSTRYNRQMGKRGSTYSNSNNKNKRATGGQAWSNDRQHPNSNEKLFESVQSMRTQCETTGKKLLYVDS